MNNAFGFLTHEQHELLVDILNRRNPALQRCVQEGKPFNRSDADDIVSALAAELTDNLDDEWEPTDYGRAVSSILNKVNAVRIEL